MQSDIKQCTVKIPEFLLSEAANKGILVRTADNRFYGLSRIVEHALLKKIEGAA
jgi:hypothetical protein